MNSQRSHKTGFTLIELLVVIAILGILGTIAAVAAPKVLEKVKIARTESTFTQIRIALTTYVSSHSSYPPGYGFVSHEAFGEFPGSPVYENLRIQGALFYTDPYLSFVGSFRDFGLYDSWSRSGDTNNDKDIFPLEFSPMGVKTGQNAYTFTPFRYEPWFSPVPADIGFELGQQLDTDSRPFVYLVVNKRQLKQMATFWYNLNPNDPRPREGDPQSPLSTLTFPPPRYDAAALISLGPEENTRGLVTNTFPLSYVDELDAFSSLDYYYHAAALFAYFMATRDADGNGELDFDFRSRTRRAESENLNNRLPVPPGGAPNAAGPMIFTIE